MGSPRASWLIRDAWAQAGDGAPVGSVRPSDLLPRRTPRGGLQRPEGVPSPAEAVDPEPAEPADPEPAEAADPTPDSVSRPEH